MGPFLTTVWFLLEHKVLDLNIHFIFIFCGQAVYIELNGTCLGLMGLKKKIEVPPWLLAFLQP